MKFDDKAPYRVPRDQSRWRSLALAAAIHAGLFLFLWIGVHWQSSEPVAVEAEVWDMKTQAAAPPPPLAEPVPAPPTPAAPVAPAPAPEAVVVETPAAQKPPDIALERRLAKLKAQQQAEEEQRQQQERDKAALKLRLAQKKAQEAQEKAEEKAEAKAKASRDAQAKARAEAQAEQDKLDEKKLAEKKLAENKLAKAKKDAQNKQEQQAQDQARAAEMRRITGTAGTGSTGTAAKSTSPGRDNGYAAAVTSKIKSNIAYGGSTDVAGNPRAVYAIEQLPTGEIISVKKIKSSGIAAYDSAVENAIAKSSPLPKKKDGTVDREVNAGFNMKDLP